jgi:hypothetical protein
MELFESNDPKTQLLKRSAMHREALEEETKLISAKTEKVITNALIIGGALAATYFLVRQFSGGKSKKKSKRIKVVAAAPSEEVVTIAESQAPGVLSQLGSALANQATVFLLDLAKEKLSEYLASHTKKNSNG